MSKRPAISEIIEETCIKRTKYTNLARWYLDMEAAVDSEAENEGDGSFINDQASEDDQVSVLLDPHQDERAWNILEEYITSDMNFPQTEAKFVSHLGSQYRKEDWTEAIRALFSANEDNIQALQNLCAVKARHILSTAKVAEPLGGSYHQSACAWLEKVAELEGRLTSNSGLSRVHAAPPSPDTTSRVDLTTTGSFLHSSHAYHLLEVEFSDNPMAMVHWESVLDAVVDADTREARLKIFGTRTSNMVEHVMSSAVLPAASVRPHKETGVLKESISSTQDVKMGSAPEFTIWLITVPFSKTSFLAAELKSKGFEVYTHSTLPGRLCIKAEDTYVIRKAWPSTHANCFLTFSFALRRIRSPANPT
ncbi:hypothetical protein EV702DRAFT_1204674 [Suillus placidus]|uniref:Uncharacterized protein n=1 Tax=Suillus placidus TaxID=48579 RepID=A0A9P6ZGG9_9AGAM|nr:hypothetical protein EV702DRAFT_1204674 [Suillus placidus]